MGYFPVRYDSKVVIYKRKMFIRLAIGLVVMKGDSCSKGREFQSIFAQLFVVKIIMTFV